MAVIELKNVTLRRGKTQILDGINWTVSEGEHWVILGPNGAGKTSLVSMLTGNLFPTTGTVRILEEKLGRVDTAELRSRVGFASASQLRIIPPDTEITTFVLTGAYGTAALARQEFEEVDRQRATDLMRLFDVQRLAGRKFGTLSDGERQRAMIARSLMPDPEALVLDEPTAGLDLGAREELMGALTELASDKTSPNLVLVTHHIEQIPVGFTHALLMKKGFVEKAGGISDTLNSENLSNTFDLPLKVGEESGRWWARRS